MAEIRIHGDAAGSDGRPLGNADVGLYWRVDPEGMVPFPGFGAQADEAGRFEIATDREGLVRLVFAADRDRHIGGLTRIDRDAPDRPVRVEAGRLTHVHGRFFCPETGVPPEWTNVYVHLQPDDIRFAECASEAATFSFHLPEGTYRLNAYGEDYLDRDEVVTVDGHGGEVDLGILDLERTGLARLYGHPLPGWRITAARGVDPSLRLADLRGRWVILAFWAHYCGPCVHHSLPALVEFEEEHRHQADRFTILTFHKHTVGTFEELDKLMSPIIADTWKGKPLPFPILLDATGETIRRYGIRWYPTELFIDPEGILVRGMDLDKLAALLNVVST